MGPMDLSRIRVQEKFADRPHILLRDIAMRGQSNQFSGESLSNWKLATLDRSSQFWHKVNRSGIGWHDTQAHPRAFFQQSFSPLLISNSQGKAQEAQRSTSTNI